ncbi:DUF4037 domain-containing protein [Streptacidiphilus neutrinimicus]|uniref:DUF4037 domain-containing protein n=1 Tax=Streptacidiphilus neutrinimicus TaxID=105420 RepID=UPI0005A6602F|nr:DUF4037 domain-containing protein [Streptacidiphilus neutrinimicus]
MTTATADSVRLRDAAADAFQRHVLPAIRTRLPGVEDLLTATVTSSVAYGAADQHSDLDVFLVFRRERDYREHAAALGSLIDGLRLDELYGDICDKGMRFEIESLPRADLSRLYHHPENPETWHQQSEWLLAWFLDSSPLHDPAGVHARMRRLAGAWPPDVLAARQDEAWTRITTWTATALRLLKRDGTTYPAVRAAFRAATAGLEAAYLRAGRFAPHPKWRESYARHHLAHSPNAGRVLAAQQRLAEVLAHPPYRTEVLADVLERHQDQQQPATDGQAPCSDWHQVLTRAAETFTDDHGRIRLLRSRAPGAPVLGAARAAAQAGETVYLAGETGYDGLLSPRASYDHAMRVSEPLRWMQEHGLGGAPAEDTRTVRHLRWRYLNFVLWRKLRVVDKAERRGLIFTCRWYQLQVVDHFLEAQALLTGTHARPLHRLTTTLDGFPRPCLVGLPGEAHPDAGLADVSAFLSQGWEDLAELQEHLVRQQLLDPRDVADPLASQWEVQYWKYENLFT